MKLKSATQAAFRLLPALLLQVIWFKRQGSGTAVVCSAASQQGGCGFESTGQWMGPSYF